MYPHVSAHLCILRKLSLMRETPHTTMFIQHKMLKPLALTLYCVVAWKGQLTPIEPLSTQGHK